jgi:hypothetical protein
MTTKERIELISARRTLSAEAFRKSALTKAQQIVESALPRMTLKDQKEAVDLLIAVETNQDKISAFEQIKTEAENKILTKKG